MPSAPVLRSPTIPFRHAPGLSLNNPVEPPPQLGVFTDGDGLSTITAFDGRLEPLAYLDYTTAALPYHLLERPHVLLLGVGPITIAVFEIDPEIFDRLTTYFFVYPRINCVREPRCFVLFTHGRCVIFQTIFQPTRIIQHIR